MRQPQQPPGRQAADRRLQAYSPYVKRPQPQHSPSCQATDFDDVSRLQPQQEAECPGLARPAHPSDPHRVLRSPFGSTENEDKHVQKLDALKLTAPTPEGGPASIWMFCWLLKPNIAGNTPWSHLQTYTRHTYNGRHQRGFPARYGLQ